MQAKTSFRFVPEEPGELRSIFRVYGTDGKLYTIALSEEAANVWVDLETGKVVPPETT